MAKKPKKFVPKVGRVRDQGHRASKKLFNQAIAAANRASVRCGFGSQKTFKGRGFTFGSVSSVVNRAHLRRAIIKSRIIKLKSQSAAARAHLSYIQREGVGPDGEPGKLYSALEDDVSGADFDARCEGDRHQFRFIVSPEDGDKMKALKPFVRVLMRRAESDLGTKLDWVAVDHYDTGHPHTHIVLRGKDDLGKDLVIDRSYMSHGFRDRAEEILSLELGRKTAREVEQGRRAQVKQHRFTNLDRSLLKLAKQNEVHLSDLGSERQPRRLQMLKVQRLKSLEAMGLARRDAVDRWRLANNMEPVLKRMGEEGDIIKTIHRAMRDEERTQIDAQRLDPSTQETPVIGRLMLVGLKDELSDQSFAIVDATDGRTYHMDLGAKFDPNSTSKGAILEITPNLPGPKPSDMTIAKMAEKAGGLYSELHHRQFDRTARPAFIQAHVRRLEALRRQGLVERRKDGTWEIPKDHLRNVEKLEQRNARQQPFQVRILSSLTLEEQIEAKGATWLDRKLEEGGSSEHDKGFGSETNKAMLRRAQVLMQRGYANEDQGQVRVVDGLIKRLTEADLKEFGVEQAKALNKTYAPAPSSGRINGIYTGTADLTSGKYAIIERAKDFTFVPWRDVLERNLNRPVSGVMRNGQVSWSLSKDRGPSRG